MRLLCLHGSRQTDSIFASRLSTLTKKLDSRGGIELVFANGPHEVPVGDGQDAATRCWFRHQGLTGAPVSQIQIVNDWAASFNSLVEFVRQRGPFDGILGFSQGAAAALLVLALREELARRSGRPCDFKVAILAGGYVPEPLDLLLISAAGGAGGASCRAPTCAAPIPVRSLHMYSPKDSAVTQKQSLQLKDLFLNPEILEHDQGHAVPQRSAHVQRILEFLSSSASAPTAAPAAAAPRRSDMASPPQPGPPVSLPAEQEEEIEALRCIFMEQLQVTRASVPALFSVALGLPDDDPSSEDPNRPPSSRFRVIFILPMDYPAVAPLVEVEGPLALNDPMRPLLREHIASVLPDFLGMPAIFAIIESIREWVDVNLTGYTGVGRAGKGGATPAALAAAPAPAAGAAPSAGIEEGLLPNFGGGGDPYRLKDDHWCLREDCDEALLREATAEAAAAFHRGDVGPWACASASNLGSRWEITVGLVGKPSAGKSTFFNATTQPATEEGGAKVAAFPFTTILPNLGRGYFAAPCPCVPLGCSAQCAAGFGHVSYHLNALNAEFNQPSPAWFDRTAAETGGAGGAATSGAAPSTSGTSSTLLGGKGVGDSVRWRRVPVIIKDVAGLVPGAYLGRGRGNAFLNDLVDSDVLIHVVDISGTTDHEGNLVEHVSENCFSTDGGAGPSGTTGTSASAASQGTGPAALDPLDEIRWVREEIHRWIFDNVKAKWAAIVRRPDKLPQMFTGYHANPLVIERALAAVGLTPRTLDQVRHWGELNLHRLVAYFLRVRFPVVLALNKADLGAAPDRIRRVLTEMPWEPAVAVSAKAETWLCQQRRAGRVLYGDGAREARLAPSAAAGLTKLELDTLSDRLVRIDNRILKVYGGTGVLATLTAAVALCDPVLAFPVADLMTFESLQPLHFVKDGKISASLDEGSENGGGKPAEATDRGAVALSMVALVPSAGARGRGDASRAAPPPVLRDTVVLHPGSTVDDLFTALKKPPVVFLEGDFVRSEGYVLDPSGKLQVEVAAAAPPRPIRKEEAFGWGPVVKLMTTRKSQWQRR